MTPDQPLTVQVTGRGGVPFDGVGAAVLSLVATQATRDGWATVYPTGEDPPLASSINYAPGQNMPNIAVSKLGTNGTVTITTSAPVHLVIDVTGWFPKDQASKPSSPHDSPTPDPASRPSTDAAPAPGSDTDRPTTHRPGHRPRRRALDGVGAAVLSLVATQATRDGWATVYPTGEDPPSASSINYAPGQNMPNIAVSKLGTNGTVTITTSAPVHLVIDVTGWFSAGSGQDSSAVAPATTKIMGAGDYLGPIEPAETFAVVLTPSAEEVSVGDTVVFNPSAVDPEGAIGVVESITPGPGTTGLSSSGPPRSRMRSPRAT